MTLEMTVEDLANEINAYESDTFSSASSAITREESAQVAKRLLAIWSQRLDGEIIRNLLDDVREIL